MKFLAKPIVRWIVFLPGALIVSMLVNFCLLSIQGVFFGEVDTVIGRTLAEWISTYIGGSILIYIAAWLVPARKLIVSVVLALCLAISCIYTAYMYVSVSGYIEASIFALTAFSFLLPVYLVRKIQPDIKFNQ